MINGSILHLIYEKEIEEILGEFKKTIEGTSKDRRILFCADEIFIADYEVEYKERCVEMLNLAKKKFDELYGDSFTSTVVTRFKAVSLAISLKKDNDL